MLHREVGDPKVQDLLVVVVVQSPRLVGLRPQMVPIQSRKQQVVVPAEQEPAAPAG